MPQCLASLVGESHPVARACECSGRLEVLPEGSYRSKIIAVSPVGCVPASSARLQPDVISELAEALRCQTASVSLTGSGTRARLTCSP